MSSTDSIIWLFKRYYLHHYIVIENVYDLLFFKTTQIQSMKELQLCNKTQILQIPTL